MTASDSAQGRPEPAPPGAGRAPAPEAQAVTATGVLQRTPGTGWVLWTLLTASVGFWIVAWYGEAFASMAAIWWSSETFAHGLVVYPMAAWLVWRNRAQLAVIEPRPCLWALVPVSIAGFGWLVADAGGVQAGQHLCAVVLLALIPWAVLGTRVARAIAFPLAFTLFAAPIGEFLMPLLMEHTADFTVFALRLTGIPVYREGLNFMVPSGSWSVVEACSGLRYLIASVMLGCLYAYLTYRSPWRRATFIVVSAIVPIVANWLRAYMIVMLGHLSGMKLAVGVDHLIYGWVFFGLVMLAIFWIGSLWREDLVPAPRTAGTGLPESVGAQGRWALPVVLLIAVVAVVWPAYGDHLDDVGADGMLTLSTPGGANGWQVLPEVRPDFTPRYGGARARMRATFASGDDRVGVFVGYYYAQGGDNELINFHNTIVPSRDSEWMKLNETTTTVVRNSLDGVQTRLRGPGGGLTVWHWYWVAGRWTARREEAKILQAVSRLLGRGDDAAVVVLYTTAESEPHDRSRARLESFAGALLPGIESSLVQARNGRIAASGVQRRASAGGAAEPSR